MRKIATRIEYSPSIIYHYFKDKDDIINHIVKKTYQKIIGSLASTQINAVEPAQKLKEMTRNYIDIALEMSDEYITIMLSRSPAILEHTSVLFNGASQKRPALGILCKCLKELHPIADDNLLELTAQVMWSATFGLIIRLTTEKTIDAEQKEKLIEHHLDLIINGMARDLS